MELRDANSWFKTRWAYRAESEPMRETLAAQASRTQAARAAKVQAKKEKETELPPQKKPATETVTPKADLVAKKNKKHNKRQAKKQAQKQRLAEAAATPPMPAAKPEVPVKTALPPEPQQTENSVPEGVKTPSFSPNTTTLGPKNSPKAEREATRKRQEQQVINQHLQAVLETLRHVTPTKQTHELQEQTLKLMRSDKVEPKQFLDYSRQLAEAEKSSAPLAAAVLKSRALDTKGTDKDVWARVSAEVKALNALEAKGKPLAYSKNLAGTTVGVLEVLMGPAGPLFRVLRDLKEEYGAEAKELMTGVYSKLASVAQRGLSALRRVWSRSAVLFDRMFPKLNAAIGRFAAKLRERAGSLLDKIPFFGGGKGKGRLGKVFGAARGLAAAGATAVSFLSTPAGQAAGMGILALAMAAKDKVSQASDAIGAIKYDPEQGLLSVNNIAAGLKSVASSVSDMFGGLGDFFRRAFGTLAGGIVAGWSRMGDAYNRTRNAVSDGMTWLAAQRDSLWTGVVDWFESAWSSLKKLIPQSVKDAGAAVLDKGRRTVKAVGGVVNKAADGVKSVLGLKDPKGGDGVEQGKDGGIKAKAVEGAGDAAVGRRNVRVMGGVDLSGMNPALMENFYSMVGEYNAATKKSVQVNSGHRSKEKQAQLKKDFPGKAAAPGYSMHEFGLALDINSAEASEMERMGLFAKYGFVRPVSGEAWHVEPASIQGQKSAIRKGAVDADVAAMVKPEGAPKGDSEGVPAVTQQVADAGMAARGGKPGAGGTSPDATPAGKKDTTSAGVAPSAMPAGAVKEAAAGGTVKTADATAAPAVTAMSAASGGPDTATMLPSAAVAPVRMAQADTIGTSVSRSDSTSNSAMGIRSNMRSDSSSSVLGLTGTMKNSSSRSDTMSSSSDNSTASMLSRIASSASGMSGKRSVTQDSSVTQNASDSVLNASQQPADSVSVVTAQPEPEYARAASATRAITGSAVLPAVKAPVASGGTKMASQTVAQDIGFYIGDMSLITMNLGVGA